MIQQSFKMKPLLWIFAYFWYTMYACQIYVSKLKPKRTHCLMRSHQTGASRPMHCHWIKLHWNTFSCLLQTDFFTQRIFSWVLKPCLFVQEQKQLLTNLNKGFCSSMVNEKEGGSDFSSLGLNPKLCFQKFNRVIHVDRFQNLIMMCTSWWQSITINVACLIIWGSLYPKCFWSYIFRSQSISYLDQIWFSFGSANYHNLQLVWLDAFVFLKQLSLQHD